MNFALVISCASCHSRQATVFFFHMGWECLWPFPNLFLVPNNRQLLQRNCWQCVVQSIFDLLTVTPGRDQLSFRFI